MAVVGLNHFTVRTADLDGTRDFYVELLGLKEGWRPPFEFPGAWMYLGEHPVLHIIAGSKVPDDPAGALDHVALDARDLLGTLESVQRLAVEHELRRVPGSGVWQLFCHDPNGAKVELDFDAAEQGPDGF